MKPVVVTASTMMELSLLVQQSSAVPVGAVGQLHTFRAEVAGREVILSTTGIGKVNAASATTLLLERYRPEFLVNTGCGGAFPGCGLSVGDLAVAQSECLADEGVQTPEGWRGLDLIGIPVGERGGECIFNRIALDPKLSRDALDLALTGGFRAVFGPFLTVSTCSGTAARGEELLSRFPGICENMEGGAVAQVAFGYGIPLLEVRGISNMVEDRDLTRWDLRRAVDQAQGFLVSYLEKLPRL